VRALLLAVLVLLVAADGASAAVVWAVGDGGNGSAQAKRVARTIAADHPRRVLYLGDVYEHGTAEDFRTRFATVYGLLASRMEPTPGNHDWPRHAVGYDPYWREVKGKPVPHHYAFSVAGWRFISLNSETAQDPAQLAFLRRELRGARGACVIPYWHRPRFTAGRHRDEQLVTDPLWREVKGRVPVVLSGHDHNLQRFRPVGGTAQYVAGAGGRDHYGVDEGDGRLAWSDDRDDGALELRLSPGVARLSFVAADGDVLDRTTVRCRRSG
jgi:predicted phosphodiesterase